MGNKPYSQDELKIIREQYVTCAEGGRLPSLADQLGRSLVAIMHKASQLGLTTLHRKGRRYNAILKYDPALTRKYWEKFKKTKHLTLDQFCRNNSISRSMFYKACKRHFPAEYELTIDGREFKTTRYKLGRDFEYRIRDIFKAKGFLVLRAAQSRGPADLVAIKIGRAYLIQCKKTCPVSQREAEPLVALAKSIGGRALSVFKKNYRTIIIRELDDGGHCDFNEEEFFQVGRS